MTTQCASCGKFLGFADLCFSKCEYEPLSEFGPERIEFVGPCCRYRDRDSARQGGDANAAPCQAHPMNKGSDATMLPCPFCGSDEIGVHPDERHIMICDNCEAQGPRISFGKPRDATERWNTRALTKVEDTE